jgi:undecaprenol kinase
MWIKVRTLKKSFSYALKGFKYAWKHEQNFRLQSYAALFVVVLMLVLQVKAWEAVALIGVIIAVLVLELVNTVIEKFIDLLKPRLHHYSGVIKDLMASVVLLSSIGAVIVGVIIFYPYIARILF